MKLLIDLDRALADGSLSRQEHDKLKTIAAGQTSELAFNTLIGFGVVAVAAGFLALVQSTLAVAVTGGLLAGLGLALRFAGDKRRSLGELFLVIGTPMLASGVVMLEDGSLAGFLSAAAILAVGAVVAESGLLAAAAVIALSGALGAATSYSHARYTLMIERPTLNILVFPAVALGLVFLAERLPRALERIALIAARTAALVAAMGFWIASLWGDKLSGITVPRGLYVVLWAVVLAAVGTWAWRTNRRWPLITAVVFAAIHFYTQWFERLGANPAAVLLGGAILVGIGFGLKTALTSMPARPAT
ncbi:MAG TPA: hypothetical protein VIL65_10840 [Beijerinckiaceae bacterium]|jgi:hypothetical protein